MVEEIEVRCIENSESLKLSMINTPYYILESVDWGTVKGEHHTYSQVNQVGVLITSTSYNARDGVNIIGWVIADTYDEMTERKEFLNKFIDPRKAYNLLYKDYKLTFQPTQSITYAKGVLENNHIMCKFKIDGYAPDPLFRNVNDNQITIAEVKPMFHFPLIISDDPNPPGGVVFGERLQQRIFEVVNDGAIDIGFKVRITAKNATVLNPKIINVHTSEFFGINMELQSGETIEINTEVGNRYVKKIVGGVETNIFPYRDINSTWLQLSRGINNLAYSAETSENNLEITIQYSERWLEVEQCS